MKKALLFVAVLLLTAPLATAQLELPRPSPKATVMQNVGLTEVTVNCSRPGVKGRVIWGGLVPYDEVWRTGANEATTIEISQDIKVNGQPLPKGLYSIHTIPGKSEWTVIFNKDAEQWGSYSYDEKKDALRLKVKPQTGPHVEWMQFSFPEMTTDTATLELAWEKLRIPLSLETDTSKLALANIEKALSGEVTKWNVPYSAASYAYNQELDGEVDAMKWIDQSINLEETYWNLRLKANLLERAGKTKEAVAVAEKAVKVGKANEDNPTEIAKTEKLIAEWKAK